MKKQNIYNLALGIICICSLVFSLIRVVPFEVSSDTYVGVIVTLLSIIVTFVVGYQIFNVIDSKQTIENQIKENAKLKEEISLMKSEVESMNKELNQKISETSNWSEFNSKELEARVYFEKDKDLNCAKSFILTLNALSYALRAHAGSYNYMLHTMRQYLTYLSAHSFNIFSTRKVGDTYYVGNIKEDYTLSDYIEDFYKMDVDFYCNLIKKQEDYKLIENELGRVLKIFNNRVQRIIENPLIVFPQEENDRIIKDSPF